jgi:SAM-dependent methyltransferase
MNPPVPIDTTRPADESNGEHGGYLLDSSESERLRLLGQGEEFTVEAEQLLAQCGLQPGHHTVDVGCGPLGILELLARRVGSHGRVLGIECDPQMIEFARRSIRQRQLSNVELVAGDAATVPVPTASVDLAHCRLLLVNVADPQAIVAAMASWVRPGGVVALQDIDWISRACHPPHPAWDRLREAIAALWAAHGQDVYIGRKLPGLLRAVGLQDPHVMASTRVYMRGHPFHTVLLDRAEHCRDALLREGLLTAREFDDNTAQLRTHLSHPDTIVLHGTFFQAWARVPATG